MLILLLTVVHIVVAMFLILVVLLQTGKGAEMGAAFGGASQTVFGSGGPAGFMAKLTTTAAVLFMVTSLSLAYLSSAGLRSRPIAAPVPPAATQTTPESSPQEATVPTPAQEANTPAKEQNPSPATQDDTTSNGEKAPAAGGTAQ